MSKIIIDNVEFDFDSGCRLLKLKDDECPMVELEDFWDDIEPLTFKEIAKFENLEKRRIGINHLGLDKLVESVNPTLVDSKTLQKTTSWVNDDGVFETFDFDDTYELFKVSKDYFNEGLVNEWQGMREDVYYVRCKDTSTDREYLIWVNIRDVLSTNDKSGWSYKDEDLCAIEAIAWTIQVDVKEGDIDSILRQGDCILVKPNANAEILSRPRHLKVDEYRNLLVAES
tara:strand:- start:433 stop:1116 length:684 start_codon:yes stop_codon:yes gene_type:complete